MIYLCQQLWLYSYFDFTTMYQSRRWRQVSRPCWWRTPCCQLSPGKMTAAWCSLILLHFPNHLRHQLHHPPCPRTPSPSPPCRSCPSWTTTWCTRTVRLQLATITRIRNWSPHVTVTGENTHPTHLLLYISLVKQGTHRQHRHIIVIIKKQNFSRDILTSALVLNNIEIDLDTHGNEMELEK